MTGRTHLILGACAAVPVAMLVGGHLALPLCVCAGAGGGLLPDIDHPRSDLGRLVPWPCVAVTNECAGFVVYGRRWFGGRVLWHRHETHSVGSAFIAAVSTFWIIWAPWLTFLRWATAHGDPLPSRTPLWLVAGAMPGRGRAGDPRGVPEPLGGRPGERLAPNARVAVQPEDGAASALARGT